MKTILIKVEELIEGDYITSAFGGDPHFYPVISIRQISYDLKEACFIECSNNEASVLFRKNHYILIGREE